MRTFICSSVNSDFDRNVATGYAGAIYNGFDSAPAVLTIKASSFDGNTEVQLFLTQILFDIVILNGRDAVVEFLDLFGDDIDSCHLMVLTEQGGDA